MLHIYFIPADNLEAVDFRTDTLTIRCYFGNGFYYLLAKPFPRKFIAITDCFGTKLGKEKRNEICQRQLTYPNEYK